MLSRPVGCADEGISATHCALEIQRKHGKYEADSFSLTLHIGVGCGELHGMHVGGVDARWEFLIAGSTFTQLEVPKLQWRWIGVGIVLMKVLSEC